MTRMKNGGLAAIEHVFFFWRLNHLANEDIQIYAARKKFPKMERSNTKASVFMCFWGWHKKQGNRLQKTDWSSSGNRVGLCCISWDWPRDVAFSNLWVVVFYIVWSLDIERLCRQRAQQPSRWLAVHSLWHQSKGIRSDCVGLACRCCFTFIILFVCSWELWLSLGKNGLWSFIFILKIYPLVI